MDRRCRRRAGGCVRRPLLRPADSALRGRGRRSALTEKIVRALTLMRCPHHIEAHQIQGLDFIHIFPVVQWLVKRVIEYREEMGDYIRQFGESQFNKTRMLPQDADFQQRRPLATATVLAVHATYRPQRRYRQPPQQRLRVERDAGDEESRVQTTLLEYGHRYRVGQGDAAGRKKRAAGAKGDEDAGKDERAQEAARISALMGTVCGGAGAVRSPALTPVGRPRDARAQLSEAEAYGELTDDWRTRAGVQSDAIRTMMTRYAEMQGQLEQADRGGVQAHKRQVTALTKQIAAREQRLEEITAQHATIQARHAEVQAALKKAMDYNRRLDREMARLNELETAENAAMIAQLRALVGMQELLKRQEAEFKANCNAELAHWQAENERLRIAGVGSDSEDAERIRMIAEQLAKDQERLAKVKVLLGKKARAIALVQRQIDEVPSRIELAQYQKRFVELYNQVAAKLVETKRYYTTYNTLDDTKLYLAKEFEYLNSIHESFAKAMSSPASKAVFLRQFESIVSSARQAHEKVVRDSAPPPRPRESHPPVQVNARRTQEKARRDELNDAYLRLVEQQRLYYKLIKEFQEVRPNAIRAAGGCAHACLADPSHLLGVPAKRGAAGIVGVCGRDSAAVVSTQRRIRAHVCPSGGA